MRNTARWTANKTMTSMTWGAALLFLGALSGFTAILDGYVHAIHPVALPGARGMAHSTAFNLLGFILPGALLAAVAWQLRQALPGGGPWSGRIGAWLALLSALAFSLQGLLPLDPRDLDAGDSRLHAMTWTCWWVAFVPAAALSALGMAGDRRRWMLAALGLSAASLIAWLALWPPGSMAPGIAQRWMLAVWFCWWILVPRRIPA